MADLMKIHIQSTAAGMYKTFRRACIHAVYFNTCRARLKRPRTSGRAPDALLSNLAFAKYRWNLYTQFSWPATGVASVSTFASKIMRRRSNGGDLFGFVWRTGWKQKGILFFTTETENRQFPKERIFIASFARNFKDSSGSLARFHFEKK